MIYRHIYWGLMAVEPGPMNAMTEAAKPAEYLVKIVTPGKYETKEEAMRDDLFYVFRMTGGKPYLEGIPTSEIPDDKDLSGRLPSGDRIEEQDWSRYRIIRLNNGNRNETCLKEIFEKGAGRPCGKPWRKLVPAFGCYPVEKVGYSIIGFPDVKGGRMDAGSGK